MRVLLVAYDFPPVGGIGVQRAVKFARYLPEFGIEPVVLTNAHGRGRVYDPELLERNDLQSLPVLRRGGEQLAAFHAWREDGARFPWSMAPALAWSTLRYSEVFGLWYASLREQLDALAREQRIDAVWTTVPHASACFFGLHLQRSQGLPWVIDVRDAMVNSDRRVIAGVAQLQSWRAPQLERCFVAAADRIVTVSQPMVDNMVARTGESGRDKFLVLPNGYDAADLPALPEPPRNDKLTLVYAGSFVGNRRPDVLVAGINRAIADGQLDPLALRIDFLGRYPDEAIAQIARIDLRVERKLHGFVPQSQAIAATLRADVALIITVPGNDALAQEVMTGKVFECLGLGRPVLALTDAAPLRRFVADSGIGDSCGAGDVAAVARALADLQSRWRQQGHLGVTVDPALAARYERRAQAGVLADLFRQIQSSAARRSSRRIS
ncbi:MAG: glycosyltransferase [Gammaproteobacteria bacterium]